MRISAGLALPATLLALLSKTSGVSAEVLNSDVVKEKEAYSKKVRMIANVVSVSWDELPWKVDEKRYKRFHQKYTLFSRTGWDPKIQEMAKQTPVNMIKNMSEGTHSTLLDYALMSAGWWAAMSSSWEMDWGDWGLVSWESKMPPTFSIAAATWRQNPQLQELQKKFKEAVEKKPNVMTEIVKKVALYLGADLVGIAPYDPRWVYTHRAYNPRYHPGEQYKEEELKLPDGLRYCIVLAFAEDYYMQETAECGPSMGDIGFGYSRMAVTSGSLAEFLRALGYIGIPSGNDTALSVPYAIAAGLGEYSRMGLLITPEYGPRVRLAKVFTDAPLVPDRPIRFGVYEFCQKCKKCADACPSGAITHGDPTWEGYNESNNPGVYKWYANGEKCFEYWCKSASPGCGVCVRVCPYNKPNWWAHEVFRDYLAPVLGGDLGKQIDDLLGYGKKRKSSEWWGFEYNEVVR